MEISTTLHRDDCSRTNHHQVICLVTTNNGVKSSLNSVLSSLCFSIQFVSLVSFVCLASLCARLSIDRHVQHVLLNFFYS